MTITRLTPDQARAVGETLARVAAHFRALVEQLQALARQLAETLAPLARAVEQLRPALVPADRPAWRSPYGPAHRRR